MVRTTLAAVALLAAAGCSGSSLGPDTGGGGGGGTTAIKVPEVLANNLRGATYNAGKQTLTVNLRSLDGSPVQTRYTRNTAYDIAGYTAFTSQETSSQRIFLALFKKVPGNSVSAGVVADGGQFTEFLSGTTYARADTFTIPTRGLASYAGSYVGLINTGQAIPGPGPGFDPEISFRSRGDVLLNADFNNMAVNGGIRNRRVVETGERLDNVFMKITDIKANGTFAGDVVLDPKTPIGSYGGIFGGLNAKDVAGVLVMTPDRNNTDIIERGVFVIPKCTSGAASPCP